MHKNALFLLNNCKNRPTLPCFQLLLALPPDPHPLEVETTSPDPQWPSAAERSAPRPRPTLPLNWEILATQRRKLENLTWWGKNILRAANERLGGGGKSILN